MALIAILLSILIERFLGSLEEMRRFDWFDALLAWVRGFSWSDGAVGAAAAVGVPALAVMLAAPLFHAPWWPPPFLFALLVLIFCLRPPDLGAQGEAFPCAARPRRARPARVHARDLLGDAEVTNSRQLTRAMMEAVLVDANERFLGIFFWFVVLGPAGALLYRLSSQLSGGLDGDSDFVAAARRLHYLLAWLPARLTALCYALSGNFVEAMHHWRLHVSEWQEEGRTILVASGFGALRFLPEPEEETEVDLAEENSYVHEAVALVRRAVIVGLAVLALLTLAGWAS